MLVDPHKAMDDDAPIVRDEIADKDEAAEVTVPPATREEARIGAVRPLVLIVGGAVVLGVLYFLIGSL